MELVDLVIAVYRLLVRAVALALSDPEFAADWLAVENALEKMGVDVPGFPGPASGSESFTQTGQGTVRNPDGSVTLRED